METPLAQWAESIAAQGKRLKLAVGTHAVVYNSTGSTNDLCWNIVGDLLNVSRHSGLVVLADHQTAGRGRRGNHWLAAPGHSVLMSVLLERSETIENLTLIAGLAAAIGIENANDSIAAEIKWPNDVLIAGKKIAGVLVEGRSIGNTNIVVVGIGVNVHQQLDDFPSELRRRATSCAIAADKTPDRLRVIEKIIEALDKFSDPRAGSAWMPLWKQRCTMLGNRYLFESSGKQIEAEVVDIDPLQGLIVRDTAGAMHFLQSATTTIIPQ